MCWSGNVAASAVAKSMLFVVEAWLNAFEMLTH